MTTFLFITNPAEHDPDGVKFGGVSWSCCKSTVAGDRAFAYLTGGIGIKYEWKVVTDAEPDDEWFRLCEVEHLREFRLPITIGELIKEFSRSEWAAPYTQFRGHKTLVLTDEIADRIRSLRIRPMRKPRSAQASGSARDLEKEFLEGEARAHSSVSRSAALRAKAKEHWGLKCYCCGFDFEQFYGPIGRGVGIVHHLEDFSELDGQHRTATVQDVRVVCANCHQIIHRKRQPIDVDEVKEQISASWTTWSRTGIKRMAK